MSQEITSSLSLSIANGNLSFSRSISNKIDMAGTHFGEVAQTIGTTEEALAINTDIATLGIALFRNLDATNYVTIGIVVSATYYPFARLKPGEAYPLRLEPGVAYYAKAHTASVVLEHAVAED